MRNFRAVLSLVFVFSVVVDAARAQIVRRLGGGGIVVRAPFAPTVVVPFGRPILPRRVFVPPVYGPAPVYGPRVIVGAAPVAPAAAQFEPTPYGSQPTLPEATPSAPRVDLPTAGELQGMDDAGLLNAAVGIGRQLDAELARFDTGSMWQEHLRLPSDALPAPSGNRVTLGLSSIERTLARFDAIAANPKYTMISSLPSFVASQAVLGELVQRFGARRQAPTIPPQTPPAEASEELPAPGLASPPAGTPLSAIRRPAATPPIATAVSQRPAAPTLAAPTNAPDEERSILTK
jgi:hypothetical protein